MHGEEGCACGVQVVANLTAERLTKAVHLKENYLTKVTFVPP